MEIQDMVIAALSNIVTATGTFLATRSKNNSDLMQSQQAGLFAQQTRFHESLIARIAKLEADNEECMNNHITVTRAHAELESSLKSDLAMLRKQVEELGLKAH